MVVSPVSIGCHNNMIKDKIAKEEIKKHALELPNEEVCGFVYIFNNKCEILRCENIAENKVISFKIDSKELIKAKNKGWDVIGYYHSHPKGAAIFSDIDKMYSEELQLACYLYAVQTDSYNIYQPNGAISSYEGRIYIHDIQDCYGLVRDYYKKELNLNLFNYERTFGWWHEGKSLFTDNFIKEGFVQITDSQKMQKHDAFLMNVGTNVPSHVAVYLGENFILHHCISRISCKELYNPYWRKHTTHILRHESLMHK